MKHFEFFFHIRFIYTHCNRFNKMYTLFRKNIFIEFSQPVIQRVVYHTIVL
jgi:hypothetical protein